MKKISIITITFNCEKVVENTINSVINQTYSNVEYLIIDGNSKDNTIKIINQYKNHIDYFISEKDKGIYDAMNKGIKQASGEWIIFMNAGDIFVDNDVLKRCVPYLLNMNDIVYGNTIVHSRYGDYKELPLSLEKLNNRMIFCHQSCFIKSSYHKQHLYDISFKSSGDLDFFYKAYKRDQCIFKSIPETISYFDATEGVSSTNFYRPKLENLRIYNKDKNIFAIINVYISSSISYCRFKFKKALPVFVLNYINSRKYKKISSVKS